MDSAGIGCSGERGSKWKRRRMGWGGKEGDLEKEREEEGNWDFQILVSTLKNKRAKELKSVWFPYPPLEEEAACSGHALGAEARAECPAFLVTEPLLSQKHHLNVSFSSVWSCGVRWTTVDCSFIFLFLISFFCTFRCLFLCLILHLIPFCFVLVCPRWPQCFCAFG